MKQLATVLGLLAATLVAPAVLAQAEGVASSAATTPSSGASTPAWTRSSSESHSAGNAAPDLEARLEAARRRLDEAAREVAELSAERGQAVIRRYSVFADGPGRAIIGVQLDTLGGKDGVRVLDVSPGGPAADAGIRAGDVITAVNGTDVRGEDAARQVVRIVRNLEPDSKVRVRVLRDGKPQEFTLTARRGPEFQFFSAGPGPELPDMPLPPLPVGPALQGKPLFLMRGPLGDMELATLTPRLGSYFGTDKGVLVVRAPADGALKLQDGDVILSIDGRVPASGPHATRILASYQPGEKIDLEIMRQRKTVNIATTMPDGERGGEDRGGDALYFRSGGFGARAPVPGPNGKVVILRRGESI